MVHGGAKRIAPIMFLGYVHLGKWHQSLENFDFRKIIFFSKIFYEVAFFKSLTFLFLTFPLKVWLVRKDFKFSIFSINFMTINDLSGQNDNFCQKHNNLVMWRIIPKKINCLWRYHKFCPKISFLTTPSGEYRFFSKILQMTS